MARLVGGRSNIPLSSAFFCIKYPINRHLQPTTHPFLKIRASIHQHSSALSADSPMASASPLTVCRLVDTVYTATKFKKGAWVACSLRVTNTAIERLDKTLNVAWRLRFTDMRSPAVVLLDNEPAPRNGTAFKLCGSGDRGQRAFAVAQRDGLVRLMVNVAQQSLGLTLHVQVRACGRWQCVCCGYTPPSFVSVRQAAQLLVRLAHSGMPLSAPRTRFFRPGCTHNGI
jgi:hypothetical protein